MSQPQISPASYWRLVRGNANFRRLWMAQIISELGDWFYMVSLYAMLLEFTGRAELLGVAFVLQVLPQALTGPIAGVLSDRMSRKRLMIFTDLARAAIVGCVLLVRTPAMVWLIWPLLFFETVMWGIFEPARNAVVPNVVDKDDVLIANTLSSTTWSMNLFIGSALGGAVAVWLGRDAVYVIDALSFLWSAVLISRMRFHEPHLATRAAARIRDLVSYSPMLEGIRYVRRQPGMFATMLVKGAIGVSGASWVIFPIMGKDIFPVARPGSTPEQAALLGMTFLMGARGLGSFLGPFSGAPWAGQRLERLRAGVLLGFVLYGAGYVGLTWIEERWLAYAVIVLSHMGGAMVWVFSTTLLQLISDDRFRGRVFAAELAFCTTMLAVSAYAAGFALDHGVGMHIVLLATGIATLASGAWWGLWGARASRATG